MCKKKKMHFWSFDQDIAKIFRQNLYFGGLTDVEIQIIDKNIHFSIS